MGQILQVNDLHVYYGSIHAVKGVSFAVNEGEVVTLIGANGAGKSTVLNTVSGLLHPKHGSVVFEGKDLKGVPAHKIVEQSLSQVDALAFADAPFSAVSDGQRQRILLARALCQQPQLIVLDEPTSFLDIRYKLELLSVLKRMVRENDLAVLLSLHELDLARRISDTVICVAGDRIDRIGTPEEIFTSDYIAQLYHLERGKYDECFSTLEFVP